MSTSSSHHLGASSYVQEPSPIRASSRKRASSHKKRNASHSLEGSRHKVNYHYVVDQVPDYQQQPLGEHLMPRNIHSQGNLMKHAGRHYDHHQHHDRGTGKRLGFGSTAKKHSSHKKHRHMRKHFKISERKSRSPSRKSRGEQPSNQ